MSKQILFGIHTVESLLQKHPERVERLCLQAEREDKKIANIIHLAKSKGIKIEKLSKQELDRMTDEANHQGVLAFCDSQNSFTETDLPTILKNKTTPAFILILDGVQDPHNLGACLRSADAAGVDVVIAPKDKSVGLTSTVSKVASGAAETVPFVQVTNLVRTLEWLKKEGVWIYGAAAEATQTLYQVDWAGPVAIVLGAEGTGLRRLTQEHCDVLVNIPMQGSVESLNVSVACGIFLFEVVRQRL